MPQPATQKGGCHERRCEAAIDEIANSLQVINRLSTRLRQDLGESAQQAVDLEGAAARAVRAIKRLQPDGKKKG
jgi:hypothetical protein